MTNETEISLEEIKTILSNYKGLKKQIRKHISDLYDDLMDTDNLIETVSIKKTEISEMGTKGGSKKDLSDIIIRHECILKRWYREISYEIESLSFRPLTGTLLSKQDDCGMLRFSAGLFPSPHGDSLI